MRGSLFSWTKRLQDAVAGKFPVQWRRVRDFSLERLIGSFSFSWRKSLEFKTISVVLALAVIVLCLVLIPQWQITSYPEHGELPLKEKASLVNAFRTTLAQVLGGILGFVALYLAWRRIAATERNVAVMEQGQITERFTRAIEQLGSHKLEIRLGAIYALERIAKDSQADHWTVMEVLTAYIRENAPVKEGPDPSPESRQENKGPSTDIQAVLTVLGRRKWVEDEPGRLDLRRTNLSGADLTRANLAGANLVRANLGGAYLLEANLGGALLLEANLGEARLWETNLGGANLMRANLGGAELFLTKLRNASRLTVMQLCRARTLHDTELDPDMLEKVNEKCPGLLRGTLRG